MDWKDTFHISKLLRDDNPSVPETGFLTSLRVLRHPAFDITMRASADEECIGSQEASRYPTTPPNCSFKLSAVYLSKNGHPLDILIDCNSEEQVESDRCANLSYRSLAAKLRMVHSPTFPTLAFASTLLRCDHCDERRHVRVRSTV